MVAMPAVAVELWEKLLARERKLESREGVIAAREDGLAVSECTLGRVYMEHDTERAWAEAIQQDYLARTCAFTASYQCYFNFDRILDERQTLLSLQEMDLERWEEKLMEE
jgi:hypothetical protein